MKVNIGLTNMTFSTDKKSSRVCEIPFGSFKVQSHLDREMNTQFNKTF